MVAVLIVDTRKPSIECYRCTTVRQILKISGLEDNSLVVTFTLPLGFHAVFAYRLALIALDPAFSTRETSGFGPLPG